MDVLISHLLILHLSIATRENCVPAGSSSEFPIHFFPKKKKQGCSGKLALKKISSSGLSEEVSVLDVSSKSCLRCFKKISKEKKMLVKLM